MQALGMWPVTTDLIKVKVQKFCCLQKAKSSERKPSLYLWEETINTRTAELKELQEYENKMRIEAGAV